MGHPMHARRDPPSSARLVLIDSHLRGVDQHNYNFAAGVVRDAPDLGYAVQVVVPMAADDAVVGALGARACLSLWAGDRAMADPWSWRIANVVDGGGRLAEDLAALDGPAAIVGALVMLPTASAQEMFALATAVRRTRRPPAAVVLGFHHVRAGEQGVSQSMQLLGLLRYAMNLLRMVVPPDRILVTATTERLARTLGGLLEHPVRHYPHPIWYDLAAAEPDRHGPPPDGRPTIAVLGSSRADKGARMLGDIARHAADLADRARLLVQLMPRFGLRAGATLENGLVGNPLVAIRSGVLPEPALLHHVQTAAALLLPYEPAEYVDRASGIFALGAAAGCPLVVPAGTWMAEQLEKGAAAGITVPIHAPFAYATAIRQVLERQHELQAAARQRAAAWRRDECGQQYLARMGPDLQRARAVRPAAAAPPV